MVASSAWFGQPFPDRTAQKPKLVAVAALGVVCVLGLAWAFSVELPAKEKKVETPTVARTETKTADPAAAAPVKKTREPITREPLTPSAGRVTFYLATLIIAVFGAAWLAKKLMSQSRMLPNGARVLKLVDAIPLGPRRQVYVLNAYGRRLVVGASGDRLTLLSEFAADEVEPRTPVPFTNRLDEAAVLETAAAGERA